ncbi:OmpA family protein [bacterium]|nr:OmpA family protein [bacterium]MBU1615345.1 OmpA family protein [bacterium]
MKKGQIKSQIFLALVALLFLSSGCGVSKKQVQKEADPRDLQIQELRAQIAELSKKGETKRINELERERLEREAKIKSLEESLAKIEKGSLEAQEAVNKLKAENAKIAKDLANFEVSVKEEKGKLTITMQDKILFDTGKADIKKKALPTLDKLAKILKEHGDREILIEGHADTVPISTPLFPSNWELSTRRATTVLQYFVRDQKISPKRFSAAGYGEYKPIATNSTVEGRAKNRRVEVILLPPDLVRGKDKL